MIEKTTSPAKTTANGHLPHVSPLPPNPAENALKPLGEKIFLDRYAVKDGQKNSLKNGDTVVVCVNLQTGQREIGQVTALTGDRVSVQLREGGLTVERTIEHIDKPPPVCPKIFVFCSSYGSMSQGKEVPTGKFHHLPHI